MGLNIGKILDPLDLSGQQAAESTVESAEDSAALQKQFSDITQANLQPFLDLASRTLPGLEAGATPGGFFGDVEALRPLAQQVAAPVAQEQTQQLNAILASQGQSRSGGAISGAADIQEQADLAALFQLQDMLTARRQKVVGAGAQTGTTLGALGQQSAEGIAETSSEGILRGAQARAQGTQNLLGIAGTVAEFNA